MARVPYLARKDLAPEDQELLAREANIFRALANSPGALRAFMRLGGFIRSKSRLDPRLRELAILMVGYLTRAPYEWTHHIEIGRQFGVSDEDIRGLMAEAGGKASALDPLARRVLAAAREMTEDLAVSDATYAALARELDHELMVDLVLTIAFYNAVVRLLGSLQIDVEESYLRYLVEFPLPAAPEGKSA